MKTKTLKLSLMAITAISIGIASCKKDKDNGPADTRITATDSIEVPFSSNAPYTLFSFKNDAVVANTDSATTKWDFGINFVNIIVNSHSSGPGTAGVITQKGEYDNFPTAPETMYAYDTTANQRAINANYMDPNSWYIYDETNMSHPFFPQAGTFFIFKTSDNHYAKMEILSVGYLPFTGQVPVTLIYKFRYTYQTDGSRNF